MRYLRGFFGFWYDFLIGDDWGIAADVDLAASDVQGAAVIRVTAVGPH